MRMMTFAKRCSKEILRDPINLGFGLGFPLVLLLLLTTMQKNIPVHLFEIDTLAPGITVFGLSFIIHQNTSFQLFLRIIARIF